MSVMWICLGLGLLACGDSSGGDDTPPVVKNLPVAIAAYESATGKAGDVDFTFAELGSTGKIFLEFNGLLVDSETGPQGVRLPHLTFNLPAGTAVYSMTDGTIDVIEQNANSPDLEVRVVPAGAPAYLLTYDHLMNVTLQVGGTVSAGQKIGEAASNKVEADVAKNNVAYCPNDFFDPAVQSSLEQTIRQLMTDWETFKGNTAIYDEAAMYTIGCSSATGNL